MTDTKPQWQREREDQNLIDAHVQTDDELVTEATERLAVVTSTIAPMLETEKVLQAHVAAAARDDESLAKLDVTIARSSAVIDRHMAHGDISLAVGERQRFDAAYALREDVIAHRDAEQAASVGSQAHAIAVLMAERDRLQEIIANKPMRDAALAQVAEARQAALDRQQASLMLVLKASARIGSPEWAAELAASSRAKHEAAEDLRSKMNRTGEYAPKPPAPRSQRGDVAALAALARLKVGRANNPVAVSLFSSGGALNPGRAS